MKFYIGRTGENAPAFLDLCLLHERSIRNKKVPESGNSQTLCNRKTIITVMQLLILMDIVYQILLHFASINRFL